MLRARVVFDCAATAGCACGAGPAAAGATAGLAGMRCGGMGRLRLMQCVLRTVRNDAHPRTFRTVVDINYRDTPRLECFVRSAELPVSMRMRVRASRKIFPPTPLNQSGY
jgi:hypothetical protein